MKDQYILALDQGTTSSRAIIFDHGAEIVGKAQQDFPQIFPASGWVEHDPEAIWDSQLQTMKMALRQAELEPLQVAALGITNQRETTVVWDRKTGEPVYNAIVWQDRRTAPFCDKLRDLGKQELIRERTGLVLDAYFSATKIRWILENVPGARERAEAGELCFGTIDSWLVWKLTGGEVFVTDTSNASRTLLFNIHTLGWDEELLGIFEIPASMLPQVVESSQVYGTTQLDILGKEIPVAGIAGDQQSALFGQLCTKKGMLKNTYGTGCFMLMNTGEDAVNSNNNLLTTVGWTIHGKTTYALEGSVFVGGAAVQWLRDGLGLIDEASEIEGLAGQVPDNGGVYFVPALTGLAAPYWDPYARGSIFGLTRGVKAAHIARATLEGIAFRVMDIARAMQEDAAIESTELRVDGGAAANDLLLQIQADLFQFDVIRPRMLETTALGAAYLAGLAVGYWSGLEELQMQWQADKHFRPEADGRHVDQMITGWKKAVERSLGWQG
jgi:glycerol kinase